MIRKGLMVVFALAAFVVSVAEATPVTCRTGLGCLNGTDFFDWTTNYGPSGSPIPNNSTATSTLGVQVTVNFAGGADGERLDQATAVGPDWFGNFTVGDELLFTQGDNGPLNLNGFSQTLSGIGANIQPNLVPSDFTALIQAFDAGGNPIGSFSENGTSTNNADGSAIFIGLTNVPGIASVTFSVTISSGSFNNFAINQLDIVTGAVAPVAVPAPSTLLLLASGLVTLGYLRRRVSP